MNKTQQQLDALDGRNFEIANLKHCYNMLDERREQLQALNTELIAALQSLVNSCDTGMRYDGQQIGVRTPTKAEVEQARAAIAKATQS